VGEKTVISASRTRDFVRCSPDLLAAVLMGEAPARFSGARSPQYLDMSGIGALVLWTKDPEHILSHPGLREALTKYTEEIGGVLSVNLTVTGLGGTVVEPGIPDERAVWISAKKLIASGLVRPEAVVLRYDPLISVRAGDEYVISNIKEPVFAGVAESFSSLGIKRFKTSYVDYSYKHVYRRLEMLGINPSDVGSGRIESFISSMRDICEGLRMKLHVCCHPVSLVNDHTAGCIDGCLLNELLADKNSPWTVSEILHNTTGRQRTTCKCTYSRDLGFTPGIRSCFESSGACLYCYSQRNLHGPVIDNARSLLVQHKREFLEKRNSK
jgi:hypothetical protein